MKSNRINATFLIIIGLFLLLGCNLFQQQQSSGKPKPSGGGDGTTEVAENNENSKDNSDENVFVDLPSDSEDPSSTPLDTTSPKTESDDVSDNGKGTTTVVKFKKGGTSRAYQNAVLRGTQNTYLLGASKGQNMSVAISSTENNAVFRVQLPNGKFLDSGGDEGLKNYNGKLPTSGKYKILVSPTRGNATYKVTFAVKGGSSSKPVDNEHKEGKGGLTKVVKFSKGKTSATYSSAVIRAERNTYILGASGGQLMSVSISSTENNAVFTVASPNGRTLVNGSKGWSGQLPANGKYRIYVSPTRGNATYRITFAVR